MVLALRHLLTVLQTSIVRCRQNHILTVLRGSCRRLVEVEDTVILGIVAVLVAQLRARSRWRESFDRTRLLLEVLLDRHVAHESTLRSLNLVEKLALVANFDWEDLRRGSSVEWIVRPIVLLELGLEVLGPVKRHLKHFVVDLWIDPLREVLVARRSETLGKLLLFLGASPMFLKNNDHLSVGILLINS